MKNSNLAILMAVPMAFTLIGSIPTPNTAHTAQVPRYIGIKHVRLPATQQDDQQLSPSELQKEGALSEVMFALHDEDLRLAESLMKKQRITVADLEKTVSAEVPSFDPSMETYLPNSDSDSSPSSSQDASKRPTMDFNAIARLMIGGRWESIRFLIEKGLSNQAFDVALRAMARTCNSRGLYGAMILMPLTGRRPNELGAELRKIAHDAQPTQATLSNKKGMVQMRELRVKDASQRVVREQTTESDFLLQKAVEAHNAEIDSYRGEVAHANSCQQTKDLAMMDFSSMNIEAIEAFMPPTPKTERVILSKLLRKIAKMQDLRTQEGQAGSKMQKATHNGRLAD